MATTDKATVATGAEPVDAARRRNVLASQISQVAVAKPEAEDTKKKVKKVRTSPPFLVPVMALVMAEFQDSPANQGCYDKYKANPISETGTFTPRDPRPVGMGDSTLDLHSSRLLHTILQDRPLPHRYVG